VRWSVGIHWIDRSACITQTGVGQLVSLPCHQVEECEAVVASSVLNHIPDPGPELRDPGINSRTVPVSTADAPADDAC